MKRLLILFLPLLLSFAPPAGSRFDKSGVSFTVPDDWKITEEEDIEGKGYYLACEKTGANSSGLVTVTWVNDSMDLAAMAGSYGSELKKNFVLKKADPKLDPVSRTSFNGMEAMGMKYTLKLLGVAHRGHIYCFYGKGKTITVMVQEALEDVAANEPGIREITGSFSCR